MLTVGPVAENCFLFRREGSDRVLVVDPGEEAERILAAGRRAGPEVEAILLTHCHFDHIGAVAPVAAATGAPVYCPEIEVPVLADIMAFVPWPGFGPFESYDADETVAGGETLELAGLRARRHLHPRPQPRPRHLLGPRRGRDLLRRRPLPGLGRPRRPARRRRADPDRVDRQAARVASGRDTSSIPATWGSRRWAPSGRPTRSSPSWRAERPVGVSDGQQVPGTPRDLRRAARGRCARREPARARRRDRSSPRRLRPIETPAFEDTELFERGVGKSTDIVRKEMFTFEDKGGRSLTLRPEGTAPICRAYLEHGMHKLAQPVKLSYLGPFFRHERPQAGRYRQFHQIGVEAIGTDSPLADAEVIMLLSDLLGELGVPGVELRLGSLGSLETRRAYLEELKAHLHGNEGELSEDVRERIDINPLRAFDSDDEGTQGVMAARRRCSSASRARTPSTSPRSGRCSTPPASTTRSTRPWSAASTTTRGRSSPSSATRSGPSRRSAAAAATTA